MKGDVYIMPVASRSHDIRGLSRFKFAHNPRDAELKRHSRTEKALDLRRRIAALLRHDTRADYIPEVK